jgi:hypothetical protein
MTDGDTRWIERGAYDLVNLNPDAPKSQAGLPKAETLYGPVDEQLQRADSFASRLAEIIAVRREQSIAVATQIDVPDVAHPGMLVLVHRLDGADGAAPVLQLTVLNFTDEELMGTVRSDQLEARSEVVDAVSGEVIARVDDLQSFPVQLEPYGGLFLLLRPEEPVDEPVEEDAEAGADA